MKFNLFTLGILSCLVLSCSKNKTQEESPKTQDSIASSPAAPISTDKTDSTSLKQNFELIKDTKETSGINKADIDKLSEPLKAIAALYSGLGGSNCQGEDCELTTALGLGKQGSQAQKDLVKKWFPNDKAAEQLQAQDFYQTPNTASNFSNFQYLNFEQNGDTVTVNYDLMVYSRGQETHIKGPDKFVIKGNTIETINRNIWKDIK
ncbi:hypothetical protein [Chryseobacterium daeguense]|uniref:hypothetical protein n=1 Tax=Chryseobacterium daeguense TaxID=412438 RepID=UPI0004220074|nr:hypothetical protein [Chryseobacterium daeguense]